VKYKGKFFRFNCGCRAIDDPCCCKINYEAELKSDRKALKDCVKDFSNQMSKKLIKKSKVKSGWDSESFSEEDIKEMLLDHIEKGDMVDVANFAMFIWNRSND